MSGRYVTLLTPLSSCPGSVCSFLFPPPKYLLVMKIVAWFKYNLLCKWLKIAITDADSINDLTTICSLNVTKIKAAVLSSVVSSNTCWASCVTAAIQRWIWFSFFFCWDLSLRISLKNVSFFIGASDHPRKYVHFSGQDHQASDPRHHGSAHTSGQGQAEGLLPARSSLRSKTTNIIFQ